jgi:hypothetical protein
MVYMSICGFKQWQHLSFLIIFSIFLTSCNSKNNKPVWSMATVDTNISKASIYAQLDKQKELFSAFEKQDSTMRRTSDVEYSTGKAKNVGEFNNLKVNNCRAYYHESDTLSIDIGIGTGFGGQGFRIEYKNKMFYTEPYFFTDVVIPDEPAPTYKIVYQKLVLDKPLYELGDSLYGHIDFKSTETDKDKNKIEHWGKGYFRTRVTEL